MLNDSIIGWLIVFFATLAEMVGVFGLSLYSAKRSIRNFLLYYGGIACSFGLIYLSFHYLPVSIAYTVFTGVGTASAVAINILFFHESKNIKRILSVLCIIFGVCGLKFVS